MFLRHTEFKEDSINIVSTLSINVWFLPFNKKKRSVVEKFIAHFVRIISVKGERD